MSEIEFANFIHSWYPTICSPICPYCKVHTMVVDFDPSTKTQYFLQLEINFLCYSNLMLILSTFDCALVHSNNNAFKNRIPSSAFCWSCSLVLCCDWLFSASLVKHFDQRVCQITMYEIGSMLTGKLSFIFLVQLCRFSSQRLGVNTIYCCSDRRFLIWSWPKMISLLYSY